MKRKKIISSFLIIMMCLMGLRGSFFKSLAGHSEATPQTRLQMRFTPAYAGTRIANAEDHIDQKALDHDGLEVSPVVPSIEDVRENGYPVNGNGETYGPHVKDLNIEPDLLFVECEDLRGYVRQSEMDDGVHTPEEAIERMKGGHIRRVNVYLQDGLTCIGIFELTM